MILRVSNVMVKAFLHVPQSLVGHLPVASVNMDVATAEPWKEWEMKEKSQS